jgi:hypothetical protein
MDNSTRRRQQIDGAIARGDVAELLAIIEFTACACRGARDGEPLCECKMSAQQVRNAVSYAGLLLGRVIRLRPFEPPNVPNPVDPTRAPWQNPR